MTFVFVSPRTWDNPQRKLSDFVDDLRNKGEFADVRYYDGVQIEDWLDRCQAVSAMYAREVLGRFPQSGMRSASEFWEEYSRRYQPPLTEEVVLCARDIVAQDLLRHLLAKSGSLVLVGDGPDEVAAVAIAALRKADTETRAYLEARTLVIDTETAGRSLTIPGKFSFVVSPGATRLSGRLSNYGPTVSGLGFDSAGHKNARLGRPSTYEMAQALQTMGLVEDEARILAAKSGRSLTILERHAPAAAFMPPSWVSDGVDLLPALLAGGWDSRDPDDRAVLAELGGNSYQSVEAALRKFLDRSDAPLDREGGVWKLRAPVDAFVNLARLLGAEHVDVLARVVVRVFNADNRPPEPRFAFDSPKAMYSDWLRDGLANMLLMLAALHSEVNLDVGERDVGRVVEELIGGLPGLRDDGRVILSLERQLPILMEAAPSPLLSALELLLEGELLDPADLFLDASIVTSPQSRLPEVLWALEVLAWDPVWLHRVTMILGRLAMLDPGSRSGNRPIGSLRSIFLAWAPNTNAPLSVRLAVLDHLITSIPSVGWQILCELLPRIHDTSFPTARPRFRESGGSTREKATLALVQRSYVEYIDRALLSLGDDVERWSTIIEAFANFPPPQRGEFLGMLGDWASQKSEEERTKISDKLVHVAARHARFRHSDWALPDGDLRQLQEVISRLESRDPIEKAKRLFNESSFGSGVETQQAKANSDAERQQIVAQLAISGPREILRLADIVSRPSILIESILKLFPEGQFPLELLVEAVEQQPSRLSFARGLVGSMRRVFGPAFLKVFVDTVTSRNWSEETTVQLLLEWPESRSTWDLVASFGAGAETSFWKQREPHSPSDPSIDLQELIEKYLSVERAGAAMSVIHGKIAEIPFEVIERLLASKIAEINSGIHQGAMDFYYVEEIFKNLADRSDIPQEQLAVWEFRFLPMLEGRGVDLAIHRILAKDPHFFVHVLSLVFREDNSSAVEADVSAAELNRARAAYRLLHDVKIPPAEMDGVVNSEELNTWVDGVLSAAQQANRSQIAQTYLGKFLARSSELDGVWPQAPIADTIERVGSAKIEQGILIERINMRGVFSKGMFEGGDQERDLAARVRHWISQVPPARFRTVNLLDRLAKHWDQEAKEADDRAARDRLRFD